MEANLLLTNFSLCRIYSVDLGFVSTDGIEEFNKKRGLTNFLSDISMAFQANLSVGSIESISIDFSRYSKTDKKHRNTFSIYYQNNLMPLVFSMRSPICAESNFFSFSISQFRLSYHGAISLRVLSKKINITESISISDFIEDYYKFIELQKEKVVESLNLFFSEWNKTTIQLKLSSNENLFDNLESFEIFDFNFLNTDIRSINELFQLKDLTPLKQLARLFRMTKSSYMQYDESKLKEIREQNLGNRSDELWIINDERLVRNHPDQNVYLQAFLEDIILGIEILKLHEANLIYLYNWIIAKRSFLRENLYKDEKLFMTKFYSFWTEIVTIYENSIEPFVKLRGAKHSFYNILIAKVKSQTNIVEFRNDVKDEFEELFATLNSVSSLQSNQTSYADEQINLIINRDNQKLNNRMLLLTFIVLIAGVLQLISVIVPYFIKDSKNTENHSPKIEGKKNQPFLHFQDTTKTISKDSIQKVR